MDSGLKLEIGAMIREHDALVSSETAPGDRAGLVMGAYTLVEPLGEGGFGMVWLAEQAEPVKRQVALKILKAGMDTREVLARFEQERQALAVMDHPGIARVLDAGTTPSGRPFFVMELVRGVMITRYCDDRQLSTPERLALFMEVCLAVQHAHQKGIIHRDLKPANILVAGHEGRAQVKVIDFGIAKATAAALTDLTIITQLHRLIGTPAYMSPEQITGAQDVDTRADIYSLGVVLYELLAGRTPFEPGDLLAAGRDGMIKMLRERPAPKPSTRLKTLDAGALQRLAANRQTRPPEFLRLLRGDLDLILMKALEKERDRRYDAANALRADVERFLQNEPVLARAPTPFYLMRQFARRNRVAVTGAAAVLLSIIMGLAASTFLFLREREARRVADAEVRKSRQVSRFLQDTLASAGVSKSLGRDATMMREVLDNTAQRIGRELADQPEVEAELRGAIGGAYEDIDEYPKATEHLARALELRRRQFAGRDDAALAKAVIDYAASLEKQGQFAKVVPLAREGIAMLERTLGPEHPETGDALSELAWSLMKSGHDAEALGPAQRAMKLWERTPGDERLREAPKTLACILSHLGKGAEAEEIYRREIAALKKQLGPEHPQLVVELDDFGMQLVNNGKFDEAEPVLNECLAQGRKFYGDRSPYADHALARLALIAARRGDEEQQLALLREGLAAAKRVYSKGHPYRQEALGNLVRALKAQAETQAKSTAPGAAEKARRLKEEMAGTTDQ